MATSIKNCPICKDELKDPRLLPCIHSFCLECLQRQCRDKLPGDDMPCPVCRHEFQIPKNGVAGLTAKTRHKEAALSALCEVCSSEQRGIPATVYCIDCSQKLCERCSLPHLKWRGGPHDVRTMDTLSPEHQSGGHYCDRHKERVKIHCFDCRTSVCSMCCLELHRTHNFEQIDAMVKEFVRSVDHEIAAVTSHLESFRGATTQAEVERSRLFDSVQAIEQEIRNKGEEMKQSLPHLIDLHVGDLLHQLRSVKSAAKKEIRSHLAAVKLAVTEMESFGTSSLELKSRVSPGDIQKTVSDVRGRAKELLQRHVIPDEFHAPSYKFVPMNTDEFLRDNLNFIGHVTKVEHPGRPIVYYRRLL